MRTQGAQCTNLELVDLVGQRHQAKNQTIESVVQRNFRGIIGAFANAVMRIGVEAAGDRHHQAALLTAVALAWRAFWAT